MIYGKLLVDPKFIRDYQSHEAKKLGFGVSDQV